MDLMGWAHNVSGWAIMLAVPYSDLYLPAKNQSLPWQVILEPRKTPLLMYDGKTATDS
jgi:hypothetical protein